MDWSLLIGLLACLAIGGAGAFFLSRLVARTKEEFLSARPALRVTNLSVLSAGNVLTVTPEIENVGRGAAYDCVLQLSGWEGSFSVKIMHPRGTRYRKQAVFIVLGGEAPIRVKPLSRSYLRLAYHDRWGLIHECWYPVAQIKNAVTSLYDIQIDLSQPELTEPTPSFWTMRKLLQRKNPNAE